MKDRRPRTHDPFHKARLSWPVGINPRSNASSPSLTVASRSAVRHAVGSSTFRMTWPAFIRSNAVAALQRCLGAEHTQKSLRFACKLPRNFSCWQHSTTESFSRQVFYQLGAKFERLLQPGNAQVQPPFSSSRERNTRKPARSRRGRVRPARDRAAGGRRADAAGVRVPAILRRGNPTVRGSARPGRVVRARNWSAARVEAFAQRGGVRRDQFRRRARGRRAQVGGEVRDGEVDLVPHRRHHRQRRRRNGAARRFPR